MENKTRKGIKRRSSIITISIVIILICFLAVFTIKLSNNIENRKENEDKLYISNLDEEDMMQYEYSKIDKSLNGMYAIGIVDDYIVGVKNSNDYINIIQIDSAKEYDYNYFNTKLYVLEKESGKIQVVDLKSLRKLEDIELNAKIDSFSVCDNCIYYVSENKFFKYENNNIQEILSNITSRKFVIKNDYIYIVRNNDLIKVSVLDNSEEIIDSNVSEIYYYNYYERDRLVYDTTFDGVSTFKNIYNYYTGEITNSIKNDTYFVLYGSSRYIYVTSDKKNVILVEKSGENKYLYKSEYEIKNINLFKEGYITIEDTQKSIIINLDTCKEESGNINNLYNIKYIK